EIGEMLVVNGVKLILLDQTLQMRELQCRRASPGQNISDARDEGVQVRHLSEHVVADDQVGGPPLACQRPAEFRVKKADQCLDALFLRRDRNIGSRLDAQTGNAPPDERLQQISVITRQLNDEAARPEPQSLDDAGDVILGMTYP